MLVNPSQQVLELGRREGQFRIEPAIERGE